MLSPKWTPETKVFLDKLFSSICCFVQFPPITLPYFNVFGARFFHILSSQCIELYLLAITWNIQFSERGTSFLSAKEVVKATHGFKHSVAMRTKPINTKAVNFVLSACCKEAFNFTFLSCLLKLGHDHIFKAAGLVMLRRKATRLWVENPTRL